MSPWTAFLESLHSALIDELTERHPSPKPVLGMPLREREFKVPGTGIERMLVCDVHFDDEQGFAFLAAEAACLKSLKADYQQVWDSLIKRARIEFRWHDIQPVLKAARETASELPAAGTQPKRVVWIPFKLGENSCYLGIGV